MDRFLLAENPMRPEQSGIWIIHMLEPQAHIRCIEGKEAPAVAHQHYVYINTDNVAEEWTLAIQYISLDGLTDAEHQHLLDRAWRWFRSYMKWEDNNIDSDATTEGN